MLKNLLRLIPFLAASLVLAALTSSANAQVVAPAPASAASPATPASSPVISASVKQSGANLRWTTRLRSVPDSVCLLLRYGSLTTPRAEVCVSSGSQLHYTPLGGSSVRLHGTVKVTGTRVDATFPLAAVKLTARAFRWQVVADGVPSGAAASVRTVAPRPIGCTPSGAPQVTGAAGHPMTVALTFDDGPGAATPQIESILEREQVPATFFVIGDQVAGHQELLRRALADGDAIGDHTWDHANMSGGGRSDEIARTQAAIRAATGYTPCLVRPPYGATSSALVSELHGDGLESVLWNVDPTDWATPGTAAIESRVLSQVRPGSIVLLHDGGGNRSQTVAALPAIIHALAARGYRFATVPQLLGYPTNVA
jgi:peptidoglycan-N-acetylglucosamine deacetylase